MGLGDVIVQSGFPTHHRNHGHGFRPPRQNEVRHPAVDSLGGDGDALQTRPAVAVDDHAGDFFGQGEKRYDPSHLHPLFCFGHRVADDEFVDPCWVELWEPGQ